MADFTLAKLAEWTRGLIRKGDGAMSVACISTDTRSLRPGEAFLAFRGKNFDGHLFISKAIQAGAKIIIIERENNVPSEVLDSATAVLEVINTLQAWGDIAHHLRMQFDIPVLGLTGSLGKTSTRGFIANVLRQKYDVLENEKNYNNLIGVPNTLMQLRSDHQWAVLELGTDTPGEIPRLTEIVSPTMALITGIYPSHLESFGSMDMILEEKGSLLKGLQGEDPISILADDSYRLERLKDLAPGKVITYGVGSGDYSASAVVVDSEGRPGCLLSGGGVEIPVKLQVLGAHQIKNALAGFVVGCLAGVSPEAIKVGLEGYTGAWGRLDKIKLNCGAIMLKDVYNANPDSTRAAVDVLQAVKGKRKIAVLGDMLELGDRSDEMHRDIGRTLATENLDWLITTGPQARSISEEAHSQDFGGEIEHFDTNKEAAEFIQSLLKNGDVILLKASRSMFFEQIADYLETAVETSKNKGVEHA